MSCSNKIHESVLMYILEEHSYLNTNIQQHGASRNNHEHSKWRTREENTIFNI